jgi:hypothetical protein
MAWDMGHGMWNMANNKQVLGAARMLPIGPGGLQSGFSFSTLRYARRDFRFRKKKSGPRTPRPPGGPPVLGSLVGVAGGWPGWRAEGLPSA